MGAVRCCEMKLCPMAQGGNSCKFAGLGLQSIAGRGMMAVEHDYTARVVWTGDLGDGTRRYQGYARNWEIRTPGKPVVRCSNDPLLGGDPELCNPEDMLLATVSACHMLWYLHLASEAGIVVRAYEDDPLGVGETAPNGAGRFVRATLRPRIAVEVGADLGVARGLHGRVHEFCFIARSVNFPIEFEPVFSVWKPAG